MNPYGPNYISSIWCGFVVGDRFVAQQSRFTAVFSLSLYWAVVNALRGVRALLHPARLLQVALYTLHLYFELHVYELLCKCSEVKSK